MPLEKLFKNIGWKFLFIFLMFNWTPMSSCRIMFMEFWSLVLRVGARHAVPLHLGPNVSENQSQGLFLRLFGPLNQRLPNAFMNSTILSACYGRGITTNESSAPNLN